jgi:hypothetical protein
MAIQPNFTLEPNQSATFRYRILISPEIATSAEADSAYNCFAATKIRGG